MFRLFKRFTSDQVVIEMESVKFSSRQEKSYSVEHKLRKFRVKLKKKSVGA